MSIFTRLFRRKESLTWGAIIRANLPGAKWTSNDYESLSKAGYQNCMTAYACVRLIAKTAAGIEWKLTKLPRDRRGKPEEMDETHDFMKLLARPNPMQSQYQFFESLMSYFLLSGNSYVELVGPIAGVNRGKPRELYTLRPDRMKIIPGDAMTYVSGYEYKVGGEPTKFDFNQIIHTKLFHPTDDWYGLSPIEVASMGVDTLNMSTEWNMRLLQNDGRPSGVWKAKGGFRDEETREATEQALQEKLAGYKNAGRAPVLEGEVEWQALSINPHDMDWLNSEKTTQRKVCSVFQVAPELIGDSDNKTYSNYSEARRALYIETVLPVMRIFRDEFNHRLTPAFGERLRLSLNLDKLDALKEDRKTVFDYASKADWLTDNEKREITGHDNIGPDGDIIWKPMNLVPASTVKTSGSKSGVLIKSRNAKGFWQAPERKRALWDGFVARVKAKEKPFELTARKYLMRQADEVRSALKDFDNIDYVDSENLISLPDETDRYVKDFMPWYMENFESAGEAGMRSGKGEIFMLESKDVTDPEWMFTLNSELEERLQQMVFNSGTQVNETLIDIIYRQIKTAQADNWTVEELTQNLWEKLGEFAPWRARMWARTEGVKVENWGQYEGYVQTEFVERRGWLSAFTDDTRPEHMEADRKYSDDPLPLSQPFEVAGEMIMYPGDPTGSPGNVINCLCSTYPDVGEL
jgi:HK97 family phage portal protein